jgi:hypothetical protein
LRQPATQGGKQFSARQASGEDDNPAIQFQLAQFVQHL